MARVTVVLVTFNNTSSGSDLSRSCRYIVAVVGVRAETRALVIGLDEDPGRGS